MTKKTLSIILAVCILFLCGCDRVSKEREEEAKHFSEVFAGISACSVAKIGSKYYFLRDNFTSLCCYNAEDDSTSIVFSGHERHGVSIYAEPDKLYYRVVEHREPINSATLREQSFTTPSKYFLLM